jgi:hypothetical protein
LFVLGAVQTLGRAQPEQHRSFLQLCDQQGWLDVFALPRADFKAETWIGIVRDYLANQIQEQEFFHWLKLYVPVFQMSNWLDEYVELFISANRILPVMSFDEFLAPSSSATLQGGGISAPPLHRTLGIGANFVLREMARAGLVTNPQALRHCFVPGQRVRRFMEFLGCTGMAASEPRSQQSGYIADFLTEHLGLEFTFNNSFDIPLAIVAGDRDLQHELFHASTSGSDDDTEDD